MLISQEELSRRLNSSKNLINVLSPPSKAEIETKELEKAKESEKVVVATLASQLKPEEVARVMQVDIHDIKNASQEPKVKAKVDYSISRLQELAIERTMVSLGLISDEDLACADLKTKILAAASFSKIVANTQPKTENNLHAGTINFYAPQTKKADDYKVIDV